MKTKKILQSSLVLLFCISSYGAIARSHSNTYYTVNSQHISAFKGKGDFNGTFSLSAPYINFKLGLNFNASYALTDHIGIMGGYHFMGLDSKRRDRDWQREHQFNVALGYFSYNDVRDMGFELFIGFEQSNQQHSYYDRGEMFVPGKGFVGESTLAYHKYYFQPAVVWSLLDNVLELALSSQIGYLRYFGITADNLESEDALRVLGRLEGEGKHSLLVEPTAAINFCHNNLKFHMQFVNMFFIYPQGKTESISPVGMNIGLTYTIKGSKKGK